MSSFEICIVVFFVYLCVYSIISRICKCAEHCSTAKSLAQFLVNNQWTDAEEALTHLNDIFRKENKR